MSSGVSMAYYDNQYKKNKDKSIARITQYVIYCECSYKSFILTNISKKDKQLQGKWLLHVCIK